MTARAIRIRGTGPVACTLALALRGGRHDVELVAPAPPPERLAVAQTIALSYASRLILERVGAWDRLRTTPIERIVVSQRGGFGRATLEARDAGVPALGYVSDYASIADGLREAAKAGGIATIADADAAAGEPSLSVRAEGYSDGARETAYAQHALVATVRADPPSAGTAFERFTPEGPLALLPQAGGYGVVWSSAPATAASLLALADPDFLAALQSAAGPVAGRLTGVGPRAAVPLMLRVRHGNAGPREVFIGNAAQALHPVAGQGLNLGLRDAWELARKLAGAEDPGDAALLALYSRTRSVDRGATIRATDSLARVFLGDDAILRAMRGFALGALDVLPPARRFFARRMIFGAAALP